MDALLKLWQWLKGKKTYIVGGLTVLHGLLVTAPDGHWDAAWQEVEIGLGLMGLRHGIATTLG